MELWSMVLVFGISWVMPQFVVGLLACWQGRLSRYWNGHVWLIVHHCLMWCLWRERNSRCFEDNERSIPNLKLFFFRTLLDWWLLCETNHSLLFLIFLIYVISVLDLLTPIHFLCSRASIFFISINLITCKK